MLVIARKPKERIFLYLPDGTKIVITQKDIQGKRSKLGFEAPNNIRIIREELENGNEGTS